MKKIIFAIIILMQTSWASAATLPHSNLTTQQKRTVANYTSWHSLKADLKALEQKFNDPRLTDSQKVKLFPITNRLLSLAQDIEMNEHEKRDQIATVVELMGASFDYDFASSNQDTLYFDYVRYKQVYLEEISKLPKHKAQEIKSIFTEFEESDDALNSEAGEE